MTSASMMRLMGPSSLSSRLTARRPAVGKGRRNRLGILGAFGDLLVFFECFLLFVAFFVCVFCLYFLGGSKLFFGVPVVGQKPFCVFFGVMT